MHRNYKVIFALLLFFPFFASAQGIVPCGHSEPCTLCHLIVGIHNLVDFGLKLLVTAALAAITIAGVMYVLAGGSESTITTAKNFLRSAVSGFAIVLAAWLSISVGMWLISTKEDLAIGKVGWKNGSVSYACSTASSAKQAGGLGGGSGDGSGDGSGGGSGGGSGKIADAASQMDAQNCEYNQDMRNGCKGNPGYTDCSNLVDTVYKNSGCKSPGNTSDVIGSNAKPITDRSSLQSGDVLWKSGHVAICANAGCTSLIHASGTKDDIKVSGGSYPNKFSKVIKASDYCGS